MSSLNYSIVQDWSRASYEFTQAPAALYVITGGTSCKGFKTRHLLGLQLTGSPLDGKCATQFLACTRLQNI